MVQKIRLDQGAVETLREMTDRGRPDYLGELISVFLDTFSGQLEMLINHADAGDRHGMARICLDMKSSSASVGACVLAARCSDLETLLRTGGMRGTAAIMRDIVEEFAEVRPDLEDLLFEPA